MPIYEYSCTVCGARVEKMQRIFEGPPTDCPACNATGTLKKLISHSSFHLKGSGWYVTDYTGKKSGLADGNGNAANGNGAAESTAKETPKPATETKSEKADTTTADT